MNLHAQLAKSDEIEPTTVNQALKEHKWRQAMSDEFNALVTNGTWELVPLSPHYNLVGCKWIYRIKRKSDGSVDRYKARLVAKGFYQRLGVDFHDTFSPVPRGIIDNDKSDYVCKLRKAIYGLKQAPRAWLLRYLSGTINDGIQLYCNTGFDLHAFADADWGGNKDTFSSTGAYIIYLGRNLLSWSFKKQRTVARSSTEAEYRLVANTVAEVNWICSLLTDLHIKVSSCPVIYCDNIRGTQLYSNPVFHSRMKHVAIDFHFIREQVQSGAIRVAHVSSADQLADALTKALPRPRFLQLKDKIGLLS
ncbi:retrovirus-related pol polyprotein from transposon RE1 [Citrus sinensis]|nr:retrovirus-related pol polyprotein from transposon RE1 [Citrus sinensis]